MLCRENLSVSEWREPCRSVNQDTCCRFVSVVWLKDGLGPDATSMQLLAKEDKEKKHAESAFCSAIFPFCSHAGGPQPAGGETVDGWEGSPEPQQLPGASTIPVSPCKSLDSFSPKRKWGTKSEGKDHLGSTWLKFDQTVSKLQISLTWPNEELIALWFQRMCKPFHTERRSGNESKDSWLLHSEKNKRTQSMHWGWEQRKQ